MEDRSLAEQQQQERRERLQVFLTKSEEWKDLVEEVFKIIEFNAEMGLKRKNPENREQFVGKCAVFKEIYDAVSDIKSEVFEKEEK